MEKIFKKLAAIIIPGLLLFSCPYLQGEDVDWLLRNGRFEDVAHYADKYEANSDIFNAGVAKAMLRNYSEAIDLFKRAWERVGPDDINRPLLSYDIAATYLAAYMEKMDKRLLAEARTMFIRALKEGQWFPMAEELARFLERQEIEGETIEVNAILLPPDTMLDRQMPFSWDLAKEPGHFYFYNSPIAFVIKAQQLISQERYKEAVDYLFVLLSILRNKKPEPIDETYRWYAYFLLALVYEKKEDWETALKYAKQADAVGLPYLNHLDSLLIAYVNLDRTQEAIKTAKKMQGFLEKSRYRHMAFNLTQLKLMKDCYPSGMFKVTVENGRYEISLKTLDGWICANANCNPKLYFGLVTESGQKGILTFFKQGLKKGAANIVLQAQELDHEVIPQEILQYAKNMLGLMITKKEATLIESPRVEKLSEYNVVYYAYRDANRGNETRHDVFFIAETKLLLAFDLVSDGDIGLLQRVRNMLSSIRIVVRKDRRENG